MSHKTNKRLSFLINMAYLLSIALIVIVLLKYVTNLIMPFLIAFIMVSVINPLSRKIAAGDLQKRKVVSVLFMILFYVLIAVLIFVLVLAAIVGVEKFTSYFSQNYFNDVLKPTVVSIWNSTSSYIKQLPPEWEETLKSFQVSILQQAQSWIGSISQKLLGWVTVTTSSVPGFIIAFVFTVMLSFFISVQYESIIKFFKNQLPRKTIDVIKDLRGILFSTIGKYLGAVLILMMLTAVELSIGLTILGVKNSILIAIGIAVFDALPVFGTGAIMIPWGVIELIQGNYRRGLGLIIIYAIVTVVRNIIEPKIVGDRLGINPIVSIVSIYFGFKVFGVIGMIFMPVVTQVILELDRRGTIKLFKWDDPPEPPKDDGGEDNGEDGAEQQEVQAEILPEASQQAK